MLKHRAVTTLFVTVGLLLPLLIGTAMAKDKNDGDEAVLFYPQPPSPPRLQFMQTLSSSLDVSSGNKRGGLRDFMFGSVAGEERLVIKPYGVDSHDGAIFVVDISGNGYGVFDLKNDRSYFVKPSGSGVLRRPINITIDDDGTRYVTDTSRNQVMVYGADDGFRKAIGEAEQFKPVDIAISGDRLYVTDMEHHQVVVLDKASGEELFRIGHAGPGPGEFMHPNGITLGPDERIFVTDTSNFRVQEFQRDGTFVRTIGKAGTNPGQFTRPKGIDVDDDGNIYVVDAAFSNIQILDPSDGGAKMVFGKAGGPDSIELPAAVEIDYELLPYFEAMAAPGFDLKYIVLVTSQFGPNKVVVYGFGELAE